MLRKLDVIICKIQEVFLAFLIIFMSCVLIGNFLSRALLGNSWSFAEEIGKFVLIFVTFVGSTIAARHGCHIVMTAFIDMLKPHLKIKIIAATNLFTAILFLILCVFAFKYTVYTQNLGFMSPALRFPMYIIYISLPISFLLSTVEYFKNFYANLKGGIIFEDLYTKKKGE